MRRILRKIASSDIDALGDTSTLADPSVVDVLIKKMSDLKQMNLFDRDFTKSGQSLHVEWGEESLKYYKTTRVHIVKGGQYFE